MIVCVTPNPALDRTYTLDALRVGESQRVPVALSRAGGKGINVARVLHERGEDAVVVAPVGGRAGEAIAADLDAAGIRHRLVDTDAETRQTTAIVTTAGTTNLNELGHPLGAKAWAALHHTAAELAPRARAIVCSGSLPPEAPDEFCSTLVAAAAQTPTVIDVVGDQLARAIASGASAVKPNREELLATVGGDDPIAAARSLAGRGRAIVFASLGADGLLAVRAAGPVLHARIDEDLAGNPTGAGDAAVAAIALGLASGQTIETILAQATAWSAAAVLAKQAGSITDPVPLAARVRVTELEG